MNKSPTIEEAIDDLWYLHDEAKSVGDTTGAAAYAAQAFLLIERLPQNEVYLKDMQ
jgi:hypothetical protein